MELVGIQEMQEALQAEAAATKAYYEDRAWREADGYKKRNAARRHTRALLVAWLKQMVAARVGFEAHVVLTSDYLGIKRTGWYIGTICFWKGTDLAPKRWANKIKVKFPLYNGVDFTQPNLGTKLEVAVITDSAYLFSTPYDLQAQICEFVREASRGILWEVKT